ncbi:MAG: hypothetical protein JKY25_01585 [Robiginitomaculum sp.]|nr:hypothetical protein [Robiginitomaculum sp.]
MKKLVMCLIIAIGSVWPASAAEQAAPELSKAEQAAFLDAATSQMNDNLVKNMAIELCTLLNHTQTTVVDYPVTEALERNLLRFMKVSKDDPNYILKIAAFWNHYADRVICPAASGFYPKQHIYRRALDMNIHKVVLKDYFFRDPVAFPIEVNTIEVLPNGRSTTLLDYIDAALASDEAEDRYNIDVVEELTDYLVDKFGAKRFSELDPAERTNRKK